jgi:hypothetical protein
VATAYPDDFQSLRGLWHALCSAESTRGIDLLHVYQLWAAAKRESLREWSSHADFDELCGRGCNELCLAFTIAVIEASKSAATTWRKTFGSARHRQQIIRALSKGADALEEVHEKFIDVRLEGFNVKLDDDLRKTVSADPNLISGSPNKWPNFLPTHPATTIRSLRVFAAVLGSVDTFSKETGVHSPASFSKYVISAYVKRTTAEFHDREVSALIGSALNAGPYDETAHRMWRSRNYDQLEKALSFIPDFVVGIGAVSSEKE